MHIPTKSDIPCRSQRLAIMFGLSALLALISPTQAQEAPMMDGMGNIINETKGGNAETEAIYSEHCAGCHDEATGRVPPRASFRYRPPESVYQALRSGAMAPMAETLSDQEVKALVKLLTGREPRPITDPGTALCTSDGNPVRLQADDWTNTHGDLRGNRFRTLPGFDSETVTKLQLQDAYAYPGGASGPVTAAGNTVFMAGTGYVLAVDTTKHCVRWTYPTEGRIVRAVTVASLSLSGEKSSSGKPESLVVFGDDTSTVHALDASSGRLLWQTQVESHILSRITAAPTVYDNIVYVPLSSMEDPLTHDEDYLCCSARGGVAAISLGSGEVVWKQQHISETLVTLDPARHDDNGTNSALHQFQGKQFRQGPAGASTYTPLTIDTRRDLVYASTAEEYGFTHAAGPYSVIAYDLKTGKRTWQRSLLPDPAERERICSERETDCRNFFSAGTSVLIHPLLPDKDLLVVGQKSGMVHALDPDQSGQLLWSTRVSDGGDLGGVMYGLASDGDKIYVPISDVDSPSRRHTGTLVALDPASGNIVWRSQAPKADCNWDSSDYCVAGQVAAVTVVSNTIFASFWDGHVRIYATEDGRLLRDIDTATEHQTITGTAQGGQVSGYPVTVSNGSIYITSGASSIMKPGNALLKFQLETE